MQLAALVLHGVGGIGLIVGNKSRLAVQSEGRTNTVVKVVITGVAGAATLYAALLGTKISDHSEEGGHGVTEPDSSASAELESAQKQQKLLQWVIPAVTGILIILAAQQGEQQRPVAGLLKAALRSHR